MFTFHGDFLVVVDRYGLEAGLSDLGFAFEEDTEGFGAHNDFVVFDETVHGGEFQGLFHDNVGCSFCLGLWDVNDDEWIFVLQR